jgi:hypothetical protein
MYKKMLIANNGSEAAFKAVAEALRLAHSHESEAHMIYVEENWRLGVPTAAYRNRQDHHPAPPPSPKPAPPPPPHMKWS